MKRPLVSLLACCGLLVGQASAAGTTHSDQGLIGNTKETKAGKLNSYCLDRSDNILACDGRENCIRVISPDDKLIAKWPLEFEPQAIACRRNGDVVVAGGGRVALLDTSGKPVATARLPIPPMPVIKDQKLSRKEILKQLRYAAEATSAASMGDDVFVCASGNTGYTVYRMNSRLEELKPVIKGLRGCCGQMDVTAQGETLYVAQNGLSRIVMYNRDGQETGSFGKDREQRDRYFNGCCEPKNVCVGADGSIFAAESDQCCVNRFSAEGKLLDRVGVIKGVSGCVRVTVAANRDASRVYFLDTSRNAIHILARTSAKP